MIEILNLSKHFFINDKRIDVLKELNLTIKKDKITVILGRSGCGKTTLLRLIAGLESVSLGEIKFKEQAKIGFVFQEPRLMPFLNVYENVVFPLKKYEIDEAKIDRLISMIGLSDFKFAAVSQLSGGMSSRVSLARVLAYEANLILMDEPFAALDAFTRASMQAEILKLQAGKTIIFVTHNVDEALYLADEIILLEKGGMKSSYDLSNLAKPRDLLCDELINLKRKILSEI
ncbi:ABC transporter ATP-binding protein [Campylobacter concisus]|uniref:ABC transporter ATP-binding protein n=2 Tax=Campylobacter concisus TaxID=199 RepID=UPI000D33E7EA|nr:ATP-binding cassette domain-containing protein [Campylobacter concisus]QPH88839.1 ATP-binding cassette domain-containing protein [Campylobacter concisus]QPI03755.1 ATP-binding cassette domain-containing protein [Campylobacter concisus]